MSRHYTVLRAETKRLRMQFLPTEFDKLGVYQNLDLVQAQTRAYLVLVHAEIESFFESWAKELARKSEVTWEKHGRATGPVAHLLATAGERLTVRASIAADGGLDGKARLGKLIKNRFQSYYKTIRANHGIKEENVLGLFEPLGVPSDAFAPLLLPSLEVLGSRRGEHAHNSRRAVQNVLDPETECERITSIVKELELLDTTLTGYKKTIR